jgi:hypothetical protein
VWSSLAVGLAAAAVVTAATAGTFYALYLVFSLIDTPRDARVWLSFVLFVAPVVVCVFVFFVTAMVLGGRWRTDARISAAVSGAVAGVLLVLLVPMASATNDCLFDYSFPLRSYDPCD